jgi:hypothetical protein
VAARVRQLPGGGRAVEVEPDRVAGWFNRFAERHGGIERAEWTPPRLRVRAADGATAAVRVPFGGLPGPVGESADLVERLVAHLAVPRRIGLLLVRLGGYSVGVAVGGRVVTSRTGARPVHARARAGGSSANRFARRREGQARVALRAAADAAADVLLPAADRLDALVLGGDAEALDTLRADPRLTALLAGAEPRVLDVPEPRRAVLDRAVPRAAGVVIEVYDAGGRSRTGSQ